MTAKNTFNQEIPLYVCFDCGKEHGFRIGPTVVTCHEGECDLCKETKGITHIRAFNYLRKDCPKCKRDKHVERLLTGHYCYNCNKEF